MRDVDSKIVIFLHGDHMQSQCETHNMSIAGENTLISIYAGGDFFCACRCFHEKQMLGGKIINLRGIRWRSLSCLGLGFWGEGAAKRCNSPPKPFPSRTSQIKLRCHAATNMYAQGRASGCLAPWVHPPGLGTWSRSKCCNTPAPSLAASVFLRTWYGDIALQCDIKWDIVPSPDWAGR